MTTTRARKSGLPPLNARFILAMEGLGHTGYTFSKELETSEAVISNIRKGKNPPNVQLIERMLNKYEDLDPQWLMTGQGRMFRSRPEPGEEGTRAEALTILRHLDERVQKLEHLVQRSIKNQVERNVLVDEAFNGLQQQLTQLERNVTKFTKGPRRTA